MGCVLPATRSEVLQQKVVDSITIWSHQAQLICSTCKIPVNFANYDLKIGTYVPFDNANNVASTNLGTKKFGGGKAGICGSNSVIFQSSFHGNIQTKGIDEIMF